MRQDRALHEFKSLRDQECDDFRDGVLRRLQELVNAPELDLKKQFHVLQRNISEDLDKVKENYKSVNDSILQQRNQLFEFQVDGKIFKEDFNMLCQAKLHGEMTELGKFVTSFDPKVQLKELPRLNRPLRGIELLMEYLRSDRRFKPVDPDERLALDTELEHFGFDL